MKTVKIQGKNYPYKFTISACKEFKEKFEKDVLDTNPKDVEETQWIVYLGLKYGAKVDGKEFTITPEFFEDFDYDELIEVMNSTVDKKKP